MRSGVYRVIYEIDDLNNKITILDIGHRRDIYR
ncbi:type II toxin-antitoxin system RelE family toxin [Stanieria cyanosphaera]